MSHYVAKQLNKAKPYNWLTQNSKIKKMSGVKTFNWGIPAYRARDGFKTCPNAAACAKGCYATMGAYTFSNVAKVFEARLALTQDGPKFIETIDAEIKRRNAKRIRIHDSGDFYSIPYATAWFEIMHRNPNVEFYAYTKMVSMFNNIKAVQGLPTNFTLIYSFGGTEDKLIDVNRDRHSTVFPSLKALRAAGYANASQNDTVALKSNPKIGLIYHGTKNVENTDWSKVKAAVVTGFDKYKAGK